MDNTIIDAKKMLENSIKYSQMLEKNNARSKEYIKNLKENNIEKFREINRLKMQRYRERKRDDEEYQNKLKEYSRIKYQKDKLEKLNIKANDI